jgi:hypothetical protein
MWASTANAWRRCSPAPGATSSRGCFGYCIDGFADWMVQGRRTTAISSLAGSCALDGR